MSLSLAEWVSAIERCPAAQAPRSIACSARCRTVAKARSHSTQPDVYTWGRARCSSRERSENRITAPGLGAGSQQKRHIGRGLRRSHIGPFPFQKADAAAMWAAADFRKQIHACRQRDSQQLTRSLSLQCQLKDSGHGDLSTSAGGSTSQPQQLHNRIAQGPNRRTPFGDSCCAHLEGLIEPVAIVGQIEFAGTAGNAAAMLDRVEKLRVAQALQEQRTGTVELGAQACKIGEHGVQPTAINPGSRFELVHRGHLAFQILKHVAAHVATRGYRQNFKDRSHRCPSRPEVRAFLVVQQLLIEKFQPQERAHPLCEGLFVNRRRQRCFRCDGRAVFGRLHFAILRQLCGEGQMQFFLTAEKIGEPYRERAMKRVSRWF